LLLAQARDPGSCARPSGSPTRQASPFLTMRKLAETLGVVAMSLYYYVADKDEILDGMVLPPHIRAITLRPGQSSAPSASPCSARPGTSSTSPRGSAAVLRLE